MTHPFKIGDYVRIREDCLSLELENSFHGDPHGTIEAFDNDLGLAKLSGETLDGGRWATIDSLESLTKTDPQPPAPAREASFPDHPVIPPHARPPELTMNQYQSWANGVSSLREDSLGFLDTRVHTEPSKPLPVIPDGVRFARLDHASAGISSEAGEIAEHIKHVRFHGKALDPEHLFKEGGDMYWYLAELAKGLGVTLQDMAQRNIEKLKARYPEGHFTVDRSENRDTSKE